MSIRKCGLVRVVSADTATRYYLFSRVNPKPRDFQDLIDKCNEIDADLGYKTVKIGDRFRLEGFMVLRGARRVNDIDSLMRMFPNYMIECCCPFCITNFNEVRLFIERNCVTCNNNRC